MKKRIMYLILSLVMLCGCAVSFSSCEGGEDNGAAVITNREEAYYSWGETYVVVCDELPYDVEEKSFSKRLSRYESTVFDRILREHRWIDVDLNLKRDFYVIYKRSTVYEYTTDATFSGDGGILTDKLNGKCMVFTVEETELFESFLGINKDDKEK